MLCGVFVSSKCPVSWLTLEKLKPATSWPSPAVKASAWSSSPLLTDFPPVLSTHSALCAPTVKVSSQLDHQALGDFLSQPDTSLEDVPSTFDDHSWKVAHQITYFGSWRLLPFVMGLTYGSTTYFFHLTTRAQLPSGNEWKMEAEHFEWHGSLPGHPRVVLSFALDSLTLHTPHVNIVHFPYPPPNSRSRVDSSDPTGWTLFTASGFFCSMLLG